MRKLVMVCVAVFIAGCNTVPQRQVYRMPSLAELTPPQNNYDSLRAKSKDIVDSFSKEVTEYLEKKSKSSAIASAKKAVARSLKDPGSAQFRNVRVVPYGEGSVICGEVNGKNSYGGYVGFKSFVSGINFAEIESYEAGYGEINRAANAGLDEACRSR